MSSLIFQDKKFPLFFVSLIIFAAGLLMIFSTASGGALDQERAHLSYMAFLRQLNYAFFALIVSLITYRIGYQKILAASPFLFYLFTFFLLILLVPGVGREINGSKRWIHLFGFQFQPSEFIKILAPCAFIVWMEKRKEEPLPKKFFKALFRLLIPLLLILVEPNNGTALSIAMILCALFFVSMIPFKYWLFPFLFLALTIGSFSLTFPYVRARLTVFLHPDRDLMGRGHQPYQAKIAAGSGKLVGKGPGNSLQKFSYLPEAQNDYIAAIFAEEFGFIGIFFLILLYILFAFIGFLIAVDAKDRQGVLLASQVAFLIPFQAFLNMAVVSGSLPSTGLNLPLFSQGGTSLISNAFAVALLISVANKSKKQ